MVGPIRFDGLSSGIDFNQIIETLLSIESRPVKLLESRIKTATNRKQALLDVNTALLAFKSAADTLSRPSFWNTTRVVSSNDSILTATGSAVASLGSFSFGVRKLAQSHQLLSGGFFDATATPVTAAASTISLELGGGHLERRTRTSMLNGQTGFDRGSIRITDSAGRVGVVNLEAAVTVQDVVDEISNATSVSVSAFVAGNRIVLQDKAGGPGTLVVENFGADGTATTLGIAGTAGPAGFIFGSDIHRVAGATNLSFLNDGLGVRRNADGVMDFTITDTTGLAFGVDLQASDDTLAEAVARINAAAAGAGSLVTASLAAGGNSLVLVDPAAGGSPLTVALAGGSFAAVDLGLGELSGAAFVQNVPESSVTGVPDAIAGNRLVGRSLIPGLNTTLRILLNGGQTNLTAADLKGVPDGTITIIDRQGNAVAIDVSRRVSTTAAVAGPGATSLVLAGLDGFAVGNRIRIQTSAGIEYRTVTSIDTATNTVSFDQGLLGAYAAADDVSALNDSLEDLLRLLNGRAAASGVGVRVEINPRGNGLRAIDTTGAALVNLDVAGAPAGALGIAGSVASSVLEGTDLDPQYLGEATTLASLNGGQGVARGRFRVIDTQGISFDVDLTQSDDTTLGEVIREINAGAAAAGSGVVARINDTGDGLLLVDTTPGTNVLRVQELDGGRTARDLNIAGTAPAGTPDTLNGTFEFSIAVQAGSTLQGLADAINARGLSVTASVINDGSAVNPFKLSLLSRRSGEGGRMTVDTPIAGLAFSTTAAAQDAVLLFGSNGGPMDPAVITSAENTITGVVPGLTLQLKGTSAAPVTVTVSRDTEVVQKQAQTFVDRYNEAIAKIKASTFFDPTTFAKGPLFSDPAIRIIRSELASQTLRPVAGISPVDLNSLSEVGIRAAADGTLIFDASKFSSQLASNFNGVQNLFTLQRKLDIATLTRDLGNGRGLRDFTGDDFTIRARNGTTVFSIDIAGASTVGSLLQLINNDPGNGGVVLAQIAADGFSIELIDSSAIAPRLVGGAPTATTFTAAELDLTGLPDDRIVGATIRFTSGVNAGEVRRVAAFDPGTDLITLDSALLAAPAAGDGYTLERELEVFGLPGATAAAELGIGRKALLGQNTIKGSLLNLTQDPGVAARLSERLDFLTRPGDGLLSSRAASVDDTIKSLNASIDRIEERLEDLREKLVREFSSLEVALAQSQGAAQKLQASLLGFLDLLGSQASA